MNNGKKIKIMHIAQAAGGVARYLRSLFKYMDKDRFENILVCSYDYKEEDFKDIVDVFEQIDMQRSIGGQDLKAAKAVRKLIKKYNPDIVYSHSSKAGAVARLANLGIKNKSIYNPHGWSFNMRGSSKKLLMYKSLEKIMAPFSDKIICISEAEKQSALDKKICSEKKLQVIFNGVDIEDYNKNKNNTITRAELGIPEDAFVVGMVGRLSEQKAPDVFLRMARRIKEDIPNAYFIIVGEGEMQMKIEKYADKNEMLDAIHITGWVDNPLSYVELFDIAALLSRWEGFGLVIPEYMMAGKPVVVTAVDAIPNIVKDRVNGLLVPMDNPRAACTAVLELYKDAELRNKLISQGLKDVHEKYDAKRVSKQHGELFESMMS
ncbi:MAG: glycosyltransferase family 4 protein [Acutalibacteraceae bacterium]|nr:glycosyltransferase family 4 protein [Acutalibacteraceae bacterium]